MKKIISILIFLSFALAPFADAQTIIVQKNDTLSKLARTYGTTVSALASANGITNPNLIRTGQALEVGNTLGATIPTVVAVYTDSLASRISSSASSFTLVRGTDKQSRALSGFYGFVIDEGTTSEEFLTANCVATACTIVARGVDVQDGKSEVSGNKYKHQRGAVIKITNFPQLAILSRILNGLESASSTFMIGDGSTTTTLNKYIYIANGTTNKPFLRYNETTAKWQFSDDGLNTTVLDSLTSGGLSASTTKGIFITDSKIGVSASSTQFSFNASGELVSTPYWYQDATFKGAITANGSNTITGNTTILGNATTTGTFTVNTPTSTRDAANRGYVDTTVTSASSSAYGQAVHPFFQSTSTQIVKNIVGDKTVLSAIIPAGTLVNRCIRGTLNFSLNDVGNTSYTNYVRFKLGSTTTTRISVTYAANNSMGTGPSIVTFNLCSLNGSTSAQTNDIIWVPVVNGAPIPATVIPINAYTGTASEDATTPLVFAVSVENQSADANKGFILDHANLEIY